MVDLPTGTVTFLLTDIEGSTALWERQPAAMQQAAARHDALIEQAVAGHGGVVVRPRGEGDSRFAVFARASDAVAAALALQWDLAAEPWPTSTPLRVRLALHTGEAELREGDYYGTAVNRCARLRAVAHGGQALVSQATTELVQDSLSPPATLQDLGEHRLRDLVRADHLYQLVQPGVPAAFPPLRSLDAFPHNLPLQLTSFVGREHEIDDVRRLLTTTRLLTLTGAGGCGKTRLALQVAAELVDASPDGVWFVDLAPLTDPGLVPQAVASVLGVREQPGQPLLTTLLAWLRAKRLLVVLDNCEHLLDACARLAEAVLRAGPDVTILATSRELLGVAGETAWRVPSLAAPDRQQAVTAHQLLDYAAVRLFAERAAAVRTGFTVTEQNAAAVAQVCRRLDGIPLALELAAARLTALTVEQVAARLDDRFSLLTGGRRTAMRRQQTLEAAIDWSHDLLTAPEQGLLRRLAVFAGGWTLDAAEAVGAGDGIAPAAVLDLLARLVEKSLVLAEEADGEGRYRLLETIRQYAAARLLAAGEATAVRDRHLRWCVGLAEQAEPVLWRLAGDFDAWLSRLEAELDNLRVALEWSLDHDAAAGLRLAGSVVEFWRVRQYQLEGGRWLEELLARAPGETALQATALFGAGHLYREYGGAVRARPLLAEGLARFEALGDRRGAARALTMLGLVAAADGDLDRARELHERSLAGFRDLQDRFGVALTLNHLALAAVQQGDDGRAEALLEESVARFRTLHDTGRVWRGLGLLGMVVRLRGDHRRARALLEEGLALVEAATLKPTMRALSITIMVGDLARAEGDYAGARARYAAALAHHRDAGWTRTATVYLVNLFGVLAVHQGAAVRGVRLLGAAATEELTTLAVHAPESPRERAAALAMARAAMGEAAFAAAWAEGQALTLEEAVAEALTPEADDG